MSTPDHLPIRLAVGGLLLVMVLVGYGLGWWLDARVPDEEEALPDRLRGSGL